MYLLVDIIIIMLTIIPSTIFANILSNCDFASICNLLNTCNDKITSKIHGAITCNLTDNSKIFVNLITNDRSIIVFDPLKSVNRQCFDFILHCFAKSGYFMNHCCIVTAIVDDIDDVELCRNTISKYIPSLTSIRVQASFQLDNYNESQQLYIDAISDIVNNILDTKYRLTWTDIPYYLFNFRVIRTKFSEIHHINNVSLSTHFNRIFGLKSDRQKHHGVIASTTIIDIIDQLKLIQPYDIDEDMLEQDLAIMRNNH